MRERPILFSGEMVRAILDGRKTQTRRVVNPQPWLLDPAGVEYNEWECSDGREDYRIRCPYGAPGDRLWVREAHVFVADEWALTPGVIYRAGGGDSDPYGKGARWFTEEPARFDGCTVFNITKPDCWRWRPSIHMPRWASRLTLEITEVRVERLQEITDDDLFAEGLDIERAARHCGSNAWTTEEHVRALFRDLFDGINGAPRYIRRRATAGKPTSRYEAKHPARTEPSPFGWDANPWVWVITFRRVEVAHA